MHLDTAMGECGQLKGVTCKLYNGQGIYIAFKLWIGVDRRNMSLVNCKMERGNILLVNYTMYSVQCSVYSTPAKCTVYSRLISLVQRKQNTCKFYFGQRKQYSCKVYSRQWTHSIVK